MTKIIFMGTPAFSVPILEGLVTEGYEVVAVVTQPDRPVGRKRQLTPPPVKEAALRLNLPVFQPEKLSGSPELTALAELEPDVIVTAAFGQFLPESLLRVPRVGAINVHASLLPKYRGGAPVHYAIMQGERETGVTIMEMIKKMDAGGIYAQQALPITQQDDVGTMFERLSALGKSLLLETLPKIIAGQVQPVPQVEADVTFSPNITREQERIDWQKTAQEIDWQIRGLRPWPMSYTLFEGKRLKLWEATVTEQQTAAQPGSVVERTKQTFKVACGQGTVLQIDRLQPEGKGPLTSQQYVNGVGQKLAIGDQLGED